MTSKKTELSPEVTEALNHSKIPVQRLGQGTLGKLFYFGTSLNFKGRQVSAIVTSDKKVHLGYTSFTFKCSGCGKTQKEYQFDLPRIKYPEKCSCGKKGAEWNHIGTYNPIKNDLGLNYRTEFNDDSIDYVWQTESIKKYISSDYEKRTPRQIAEERLKINQRYMDHLNPTSHKYIVCWCIGTFCYTLFDQYGRLYHRAEKGSGKTKQSRIIKFTSFNPMWITKSTEASIFRDAEATCGTFIVDNMDKLTEDLKRAMEHHIETGWMYDATYRITNKDTGRTQKFLSYTPMDINNIYGLDDNTLDKTFEIPMLKSVNKQIARMKPTPKSEDWQKICNDTRNWVLDNHELIKKTYDELNTNKFSGREYDVVEGVLVIAKLIGEDWFKEIEDYVKEVVEQNTVLLDNNPHYIIFSNIWQKFDDAPLYSELNVFPSDIADESFMALNPGLSSNSKEYANKKKSCAKYISGIIKTVPMFRKCGFSGGRTYITIKKSDLEKYMKLQKFLNDDDHLHTSTTSTTSTKSTTSTVDIVDQVDVVDVVRIVDESHQNRNSSLNSDTILEN